MSQERWDIDLQILNGPMASLGTQVVRGPTVQIGSAPGARVFQIVGTYGPPISVGNRRSVPVSVSDFMVTISRAKPVKTKTTANKNPTYSRRSNIMPIPSLPSTF